MAQFINPFPGFLEEGKLGDVELIQAIRQALAAEEEATHLYEMIAEKTDNQLVTKVMQDVAREEQVHKGEFQQLLNRLDPDEAAAIEEGKKEVKEIQTAKSKQQTKLSYKDPIRERVMQVYMDLGKILKELTSIASHYADDDREQVMKIVNFRNELSDLRNQVFSRVGKYTEIDTYAKQSEVPLFFKKNYDYPSNLNEYDSIKDFLKKRREQRKAKLNGTRKKGC